MAPSPHAAAAARIADLHNALCPAKPSIGPHAAMPVEAIVLGFRKV